MAENNDTKDIAPFAITIGRQFGSGGRELGRLIADKLGISFYDKMLLVKAAEKSGLRPEYMAHNDEKPPTFFGGGMTPFSLGFYTGAGVSGWMNDPSATGADSIYKAQSDLIHELAAERPCVIVGRSADYVLRDLPNLVSIFVHAPMEECVRRIVGRGDCRDADAARTMAERTNRLRANYYNFYTDKRWGYAESYDLCLNSAGRSIDDLADYAIEFIKQRLEK